MSSFARNSTIQLFALFAVMSSVLTIQSKIISVFDTNTDDSSRSSVNELTKIAASDDGPGGLCNMSDPCNTSAGGCRSWEKCSNGVCQDTTSGGTKPASTDSCGGSGGGGGGANPTSTPFPTKGNGAPSPTSGSAGGNMCRNLTIGGTLWEANCSKSCSSNANCPKRTSGDTDPNTSNWCYMFSNGSFCLMRNQSGGGGGGVTPGAGTPVTTPTSGASVATGCFTLGAEVSRSEDSGKYKFDVSVKFISLGGDGDVKLDRDGRHVAGWNAWNKSVKSVFTYSPQWTGGTITNSGNVNFVGTVANSAACPNVQSSMSCSFNVNDGSCSCGGSSCASVATATSTPAPGTKTPTPKTSSTIVATKTPTPAACNPGESRCWVGGPCAGQGKCPQSPTPTTKQCASGQNIYLCPDGRTCATSKDDCTGIAGYTPTPTKVVSPTPFVIVPTSTPGVSLTGRGTTRLQVDVDAAQQDIINMLSGIRDPSLVSVGFASAGNQSPIDVTPVTATRTNNTFVYTFQGLPTDLGAPASIGYTSPLSSGGDTQEIFLNGSSSR